MPADSSPELTRLIAQAAKSKPFAFLVMPFGSKSWLVERIARVVDQCAGLSCLRADDIPGAGLDLLNKVHFAIERSELVIAEISEINANVFYEVGYAAGIQKPILLIADRRAPIPTDLRGRELILYSDDRHGLDAFSSELALHVRERVATEVALLSDMLMAERPRPVYILASPRQNPGPDSRSTGHTRERRTFGDNVGIVRLLAAFGMMFGDTSAVELVSAQYCADEIETADLNLFLIGSKKNNPICGRLMEALQVGSDVSWRFSGANGAPETGDYPVSLFRKCAGLEYEIHGRKDLWRGNQVHVEDHGLVLRGPHPYHQGRLITIMAGAHSLGTAAACVAATHTPVIRAIVEKGIDIAKREQAFWALVHGTASSKDGLLDLDSVSVLQAGVCAL
jgi:hypothetical protein